MKRSAFWKRSRRREQGQPRWRRSKRRMNRTTLKRCNGVKRVKHSCVMPKWGIFRRRLKPRSVALRWRTLFMKASVARCRRQEGSELKGYRVLHATKCSKWQTRWSSIDRYEEKSNRQRWSVNLWTKPNREILSMLARPLRLLKSARNDKTK